LDIKNFVEQISTKFGGLYLIKMNLVQIVQYRQTHQNIHRNLYTGIG